MVKISFLEELAGKVTMGKKKHIKGTWKSEQFGILEDRLEKKIFPTH